MPLINTNTNTVPSFRDIKGGGAPPVATVNWKMLFKPVDPLQTFDVGGFQFDLTGPAGTNNIVTQSAGPADPGFTLVGGATTVLAFSFSGLFFTVSSAPSSHHILNLEMTNTNILPLGTSLSGPTVTAAPPGGLPNWNIDVYVQPLGSPGPGILTQQQSPADINAYLIQL